MDGNGRWAQRQKLPRAKGHQQGGKTVEQIALDAVALGIEYLTLYSFSTENWKRPKLEINGLMKLYTKYLIGIRPMMMENQVRLVHLGTIDRLPKKVTKALAESIELTKNNKGMTLVFALDYSGRSEIANTAAKIAQKCLDNQLTPDQIDEDCFMQNLYDPTVPDPDLLVRTAGEMRVSNFLLWQISYSEFYVTDICWPDFKKADLEKAIVAYADRTRQFGDVIS